MSGALREIFAKFGFDFESKKVEDAHKSVNGLAESLRGVALALTGGLIAEGVKRFAEQLDVFDDLSDQTGLATDQLQLYSFAAKVSGSSSEEMAASLTLLQKSLGHTADATGEQVKALHALGIGTKDAAGQPRKLADILPEIFGGFGKLTSEAKQAEVATALFGRGGVKLLPTLRRGSAGLADLNTQMQEFGGPVSADTIQQAGAFRDNLARLDVAFFSLKGQLAAGLFPQLSKIVVGFGHGIAKLGDWISKTTVAESATTALAGTIGITLAKSLAPYLKSGLKFGAIFLAFDELIGFLRGQESVIGSILDRLFGPGAQGRVRAQIQQMTAGISALWDKHLGETHDRVQAFVDTLSDPAFWSPIVEAFGAAISGLGKAVAKAVTKRVFGDQSREGPALQGDLAGGPGETQTGLFSKALSLVPGFDAARRKNTADIDAQARASIAARNKAMGLETSVDAAHAGGGGIYGKDRTSGADETTSNFAASLSALVRASKPNGMDLGISPAPMRAPVALPGQVVNKVTVNTPITIQVPDGTPAQVVRDAGKAAATAVQSQRRQAEQALTQRAAQ